MSDIADRLMCIFYETTAAGFMVGYMTALLVHGYYKRSRGAAQVLSEEQVRESLSDDILLLDDELAMAAHENAPFERRAKLIEEAFMRVLRSPASTSGEG